MIQSVRVRALTNQELEDKLFLKSSVGQQVATLGRSVSIFGPADHIHIGSLNIDMSSKWAFDSDMGMYDGPPRPLATGGRTVSVLWGTSDAFTYLRTAAQEQGMSVFCDGDLMYFESRYADAVIDAFSYVDRTFHELVANSSFLSRFFGGGIPDWNSKESKVIQQKVSNFFARVSSKRSPAQN